MFLSLLVLVFRCAKYNAQGYGKDPVIFQHVSFPAHKTSFIKRWFFQHVVEDPDRLAPSPNPIQQLTRAQTANQHWSKSDCTHVYLSIYLFMAEWHQMPVVSFQNLGVETVVAACLMIRGGTACSVIKYWHNICTLFICVFHLPAHRCPLRTNTRHSHMFHI